MPRGRNFSRNFRAGLVALLSGAAAIASEFPLEMPALQASTDDAGNFVLNWDTVAGQSYLVESSASLLPGTWVPAGGWRVADGSNMNHQVPATGIRKFFRLAVTPENFDPAELSPLWQLDATTDFPALMAGAAVSRWTGT